MSIMLIPRLGHAGDCKVEEENRSLEGLSLLTQKE